MNHQIKVDRTININTLIAVAGFAIVILGGVFTMATVYSKLQTQAEAWTDFQKRQETYNVALDVDRKASGAASDVKLEVITQALGKLTSLNDQVSYQIGQLQKKDEETDARLGRMTESYGDKFTEIQGSLATMTTQLALQSQSLAEMKTLVTGTTSGKMR